MSSRFYLARPYFRVPLVQDWLLEATSEEEALQSHASGDLLTERLKKGGEEVQALSEADVIGAEKARRLRLETYTVVGRSTDRPEGFTETVRAQSPRTARMQFSGPGKTVFAVLEGSHQNLA